MDTSDFAVVGGGIVGLAVARRLQALHPDARITVFEKEPAVGQHQTGHNSGVIHAGVYYAPGSLKAQFCRDGVTSTRAFCDENGIPYMTCGKLIVATSDAELQRMGNLEKRATANGIQIERLSGDEARALEPSITSVGALLASSTGIVDYAEVARKMATLFAENGGSIRLGVTVVGGSDDAAGVTLKLSDGQVHTAGKAVFCGGLMADRLARSFGAEVDFRIVPFRGEYFSIRNQPDNLVRHLIYPVPDPDRPFLGVHLTRKMNGGFTVGPNAVLAFKREGYRKTDISLRDLSESLLYPGFWRVLRRNFSSALDELSASVVKTRYLKKVQRYCAQISIDDLVPYKSGVRAQAVARDGKLIDDFLFVDGRHSLHVCNAPSPAATSALPIAAYIVDRLLHPAGSGESA